MSETTSSSAQSATKDSIGDYYLKLWEHSSKSPQLESESEELSSEENPSELDTVNSSGGFSVVGEDRLSVSYPNVNLHGHDVGVVQANRPAPSKRLVYYFEMTVKNAGAKGHISIGFTTSGFKLRRQPGWEANSLGYHGDDGLLYRGHGRGGEAFGGSPYTTGDTVGGGINYLTQEFFFTKNGELVGSVDKDIKGQVFPTVAVHSQYEEVNVNFGEKQFIFNLNAYEAEQRVKQQMMIDDISVPQDTSYSLVRSYLQYYGYEETLHSLDEAGKSTIPSVLIPVTKFDEEGTAYALNRRRILRQQIRRGEIDDVFSELQEWYPQIVQDEKSPVCCLLHCQKFIELVRGGKLEEAVKYGRKEFDKFNSKLEHELIGDCAALIAFEEPDKSAFGYLLRDSQKELLADAVNAMILSTYPDIIDKGLCRHSSLEKLIRQLSTCVVEKRRLNGNEGEGFHLHKILRSDKKD